MIKRINKIQKAIALILICFMIVTLGDSVTSKAAYGEKHGSQFANCKIIHGIDVSEFNVKYKGNDRQWIDWNKVKASGVQFAFIRVAGRGWGSAGNFYNDSTFLQNYKGAKAAGLKIGVYILSQATNEREAIEEANYIINKIRQNNMTIDLQVVMDYEFTPAGSGGRLRKALITDKMPKSQATNICMAFCNTVAANGYRPMLYADANMMKNYLNGNTIAQKYPVWLAQYNNVVTYKGAYSYWQYTSSGSVPGIQGSVDLDYYYSPDGNFSFSTPNIPVPTGNTAPKDAKIVYSSHIQSSGWEEEERYDGITSGTTGSSKRLEAIKIRNNTSIPGSVEYKVHCQTYGWLDWTMDGDIAGIAGQSKRLEAIRIRLTGELAQQYDVYYRVHAQTYGWLGWAKNGEVAGSVNYAKRLEAIEIKLVEKGGGSPDGDTTKPAYRMPGKIAYKTHVQTYGWQNDVYDGAVSGTTGKSKRLEGIQIKNMTGLDGDILYRVHVQTYGWQSWRQDGQLAGTTGKAKRLEAIQIRLTGELSQKYDVYYRVHCQTFGWLDWAKNGAPSGSAGYAKRLEGIQIMLVPKGSPAPTSDSKNPAYIGGSVPQ